MVRRENAWPVRPGFTVSIAPDVARRQLRMSLGLMAGFAAILLVLAASTYASVRQPAEGASVSMAASRR